MKRLHAWGFVAFAMVGVGCSRDLSLPQAPAMGGIKGSVDTAPHMPPAKLPVTLIDSSGHKQTLTTADDGTFDQGSLQPGTYALSLQVDGFAPLVVPFIEVLSGPPDTDVGVLKPVWLASTPAAAILTGKVSSSEPADISGATVTFTLVGSTGATVVGTQAVGSDGVFVQRGLPPGTYQLKATRAEFSDSPPLTVILAEGATKDVTATPLVLGVIKGTIAGTVMRERDGLPAEPAATALVSVVGPATAVTTVQATGDFSVDVNPGTYRVTYAPAADAGVNARWLDPEPTRSVTVHGGKTESLPPATLLLARGTITGTVELSDRSPIDQLTVGVNGTGYSGQVTPDAVNPYTGTFTITGVPYGPAEVVAAKQRYSRATVSVTVGPLPVDTGTLKLALQQGDFDIDGNDPTSDHGYTRTLGVTLKFTGFPKTGVTGYRASEAPDFADGGFRGYSGTTQAFTLADAGDGTRTVYAQYQDTQGNISPTFQQTIVLDRQPPTAPAVDFLFTGSVGQGQTVIKFTKLTTDLPLTVTGSDNTGGSGLSKMRLASALAADGGIDEATARTTYSASTAFKNPGSGPFAEGSVPVFVQLIDHAGNIGAVGGDAIVVDSIAPGTAGGTIGIAIANGAKATAPSTTNAISVTVTPNVSPEPNRGIVVVKYANATGPELDGAPYVSVRDNTPWNLASSPVCDGGTCPSGDGPRRVYAVFKDSAGNTSTSTSADINLDTTPPSPGQISATLVSPNPTNLSTVSVAVTSTAPDLSSSQAITISEDYGFTSPRTVGPMALPSAPVSFTVSPGEGARPFFVRFRDGAGNDAIVPLSVMVDTTPPSGTIALLGSLADGTLSTSISASTTIQVQANITGATGYALGAPTLTACPTSASAYAPIPASGLISYAPAPIGGSLVVRGCFRDDAGNLFGGAVASGVSPLLWAPAASIGYKGTPPTGCTLALTGLMADGITPAPAGLTAKPTLSFAVTSCAGATEMVMANGPLNCNSLPASTSWQPFNASGTFNVPIGDGPKTVSVCVRDIARNPAALTPGSITLDTTPPAPSTVSATVTTPSPSNSLVVQLAVASTATDLSPTSALTVSEDYGFTAAGTAGPLALPASGALAFTLAPGDGARTFYARFLDRVGNATIVPLSITIDTLPPSGTISIVGALADGTPSTSLTATAGVTVQAAIVGAASYFLGDGTLTGCPAAASSYTALPSTGVISATLTPAGGALTVRACFRDAAGNVLGGPVAAAVSPLSWAPAATIAYAATAPVGCTLSLVGANVDGTAAVVGKTAQASAAFTIGGCVGATELVIAPGALICSALPTTTAWQPFVSGGTVALPLGDGLKTVSACARDRARNLATLTPATITLDQTAPALSQVSATLASPSPTNSLALTVAASSTATDLSPTQALTVSEDFTFKAAGTVGPMSMPPGGTVPFTISAGDGVRTFYVRFRDDVGNATVVPVNVTVRTTPPAGTIALQGALADGTPSSSVSATTAVSVLTSITGAVSYFLGDQTLTACPGAASSYTALPSTGVINTTLVPSGGALTTRACFRDAAGNVLGGPVAASVSPLSWVPAATIAYLATPPSGCGLSLAGTTVQGGPAPAGKTARTTVAFSIATCTGATEMAIANGALTCSALPATVNWQPFVSAGPITLPAGDGAKTVSVCLRDAARNLAAPAPATITLDQTPPAVSAVSASVSSPQPSNSLNLTVAVASTATDLSPTQALTLSEDYAFLAAGTVGPMGMPGGGTVPFTISAGDGLRTFYARFRDAVGNDTIIPVSVTIDQTPPTGTISLAGALADGTPSTTVTATTSITVQTSITGAATYYLGDQTLAACPSNPASYTAMPLSGSIAMTVTPASGALTVRACFRDAAGNVFGAANAGAPLGWLPAATIPFDVTPPTGCTLSLTGKMADTGLAAPAGLTGRTDVIYTVASCAGGPAEMAVAPAAVTCTSLPPTVAWQPFATSGQVTLPLGDGLKTVSVCVRDLARNVASLTPATITLDTTAPTSGQVSAAVISSNPTNALPVTVAVGSSATDLAAQPLSLSEDYTFSSGVTGPVAMPLTGNVTFTLKAGQPDGARLIYVRFKDQVGNAIVVSVAVVVDTQKPTGIIVIHGVLGDGSDSINWSHQTAVTVDATGIVGASGYFLGTSTLTACPAPGGSYAAIPPNGQIAAVLTPAGGKLITRACFVDAAGNVYGGLDATAALGWTPADDINFNATAPSGCTLALNGTMVDTGGPAPVGLTGTANIGFTINGCTPQPTQMVVTNGTIVNCAALPASAVWQAFQTPGTLTLPTGDGPKTVSACVRDAAGNIATLSPGVITLDTTAPTPGQVTATTVPLSNSLTLTVNVSSSATDLPASPLALSQDYAFLNATTVGPMALPGGGTVAYTLTAGEGARTFYARFKDLVGNAIVVPVSTTIDTVAPSGSIWIEGVRGDTSSSTLWTHQTNVTVHAEGITGGAVSYSLGSNALTGCPASGASYTAMPVNGVISNVALATGMVSGVQSLVTFACFRDAAGNVFGGPQLGTLLGWVPAASIWYNPNPPQSCSVALTGRKVDGTVAPAGKTAQLTIGYSISGCAGATQMVVVPSAIACAGVQPTDWVTYQANGTVTLPSGDGSDTVQVCARNDALNVASLAPAVITLDQTPPLNAWTLVENGDGWVNAADVAARGGIQMRIDSTFSGTNNSLVVEYDPALNLAKQIVPLAAVSPVTSYLPLAASPNPGQQAFVTYFIDDVGNATPRSTYSVGLDTVPPVAPVLSTVTPGNRSAALFWLPVQGDPTVAGYGLLWAATPAALPPPPSTVTVSGNVGQGTVPALTNRTEYSFAVYAYDAAGNRSGPSNSIIAVTGLVQKQVPVVSTYPLMPLDVAMRGSEIFITYMEQSQVWQAQTGNLKIAHSTDLGDTWTFQTLDPTFGYNRSIGRITFDGTNTDVTTVGTDLSQTDAGTGNTFIGPTKVYGTTDGVTWSTLYDQTNNTPEYADVTSAGFSSIGTGARAYYMTSPGNTNQIFSRPVGGFYFMLCGFPFPPCPSPLYYDFTDATPVKDLNTCTSNQMQMTIWRSGTTTVNALWHRFASQSSVTVGTDADFSSLTFGGPNINSLDVACASLPGRTDGYYLYQMSNFLFVRRRLGTYSPTWPTTTFWQFVSGLPTDADPGTAPKIYASGGSVHIVYRNQAGEVKLGTSTDEGNTYTWTRLSSDPVLGHYPVIGGDGIADLAIASVSQDQSRLMLLVPAMRNVHATASPGITTAALDWDLAGGNLFRVDRNDAGVDPWPDTLYTAQPHLPIPLPGAPGAALYHRLSKADSLNQGTDEGQIWQVAPFQKAALFVPAAGCTQNTASGAVIAHDSKVLVAPPLSCKPAGGVDTGYYISSDKGQTFAPSTPPGITYPLTNRAWAGSNGHAVMAMKYTAFGGIYTSGFNDIALPSIDGAYGTFNDATATGDYLSVGADRNPGAHAYVVASANVASHTISIITCDTGIASPNCAYRLHVNGWQTGMAGSAATVTLMGVNVLRVENMQSGTNAPTSGRIDVVYRLNNSAASNQYQVWFAESTNGGVSFNPSILLADGSSLPPSSIGALFWTDANVRGAANGATTVIAHPGASGNQVVESLFLHVTGSDMPSSGYGFQTFQIDHEMMTSDVVDIQSSPGGHYILYETQNAAGSEQHLKLAYCRTDCHLPQNWARTTMLVNPTIVTVPPQLGVSTVSTGSEERLYGAFFDGTSYNVLTGAALRRTR